MTRGIVKRIEALESKLTPARPSVFVVLDDGAYSIGGKETNPAELAELEATSEIILVRIVHHEGKKVNRINGE